MEVILVHMNNTSPALMSCATQLHCFTSLTTRLPRVNNKVISINIIFIFHYQNLLNKYTF